MNLVEQSFEGSAVDLPVSVHPAFVRDDVPIKIRKSAVDGAGYRPIAAMVESFRQAGVKLDVFRAAEFAGDLEVSPLHRNYIDPVDRDEALQAALERARTAKKEYDVARRAALDKRAVQRENEIIAVAEKLAARRRANAPSSEGPESVSSPA